MSLVIPSNDCNRKILFTCRPDFAVFFPSFNIPINNIFRCPWDSPLLWERFVTYINFDLDVIILKESFTFKTRISNGRCVQNFQRSVRFLTFQDKFSVLSVSLSHSLSLFRSPSETVCLSVFISLSLSLADVSFISRSLFLMSSLYLFQVWDRSVNVN